ncbi:MAG TPA: 4-(cytidine 5'-diphospho)-2-C-methyl-D-erythritol kinase [Flavisolibacter sp.]|nr:4-(cytidine 5'-diphospho)-2-C-methyl-D-erythritol kinase [Flavisolibacter sp.]
MIVFPNCKINLGLHVLQKRKDGFHDLETIFYPVALHDALEIIHAPAGHTLLTTTGLELSAAPVENICYKAWALLKKDFPALPHVNIHLHKAIPSGAGLGGGSSDGAFTLLLLNQKFNLGLSTHQLSTYALALGSDCPFFVLNKPAHALGRGEVLKAIDLDLTAFKIMIVNPKIHIQTGAAFEMVTPATGRPSLIDLIQAAPEQWPQLIKNDFETPVFSRYPEIGAIRETLYAKGAVYASMSGSGSSVYGLFPKDFVNMPSFPSHYFTAVI